MVVRSLSLTFICLSLTSLSFAESDKNNTFLCRAKSLPDISSAFKKIEVKHMNAAKQKANYETLLLSPSLAPDSALKETATSCYRYKMQLNKYLVDNNYSKSSDALMAWKNCWKRNTGTEVSYLNQISKCLKKVKALKN